MGNTTENDKEVYQLRLSDNLANDFTVNCNCR